MEMDRKLGVAVCGIGWCGLQHIAAFQRNPHAEVRWLCTRDPQRAREAVSQAGITLPGVRVTADYDDLLTATDVDIIAIATPNHLHADQAVAAARAGKHLLLEKPTGLDVAELVRIRDAVRQSGVRTIVSFVLRYNPFLKFARWLRVEGWLGDIRFARTQYLSRVTDWYAGWDWVRTRASGRSHLLAAGCHAVDALRWCSGLEPIEVSAMHTHFTKGYEWPTTIVANLRLERSAIGHVTSSTDFMLPYTFLVELMGDRATLRQDLLQWLDSPIDVEELSVANPFPDVQLAAATDDRGRPGDPDPVRHARLRRRRAPSVPGGDRRTGPLRPRQPRDVDRRVRCAEDDGSVPGGGLVSRAEWPTRAAAACPRRLTSTTVNAEPAEPAEFLFSLADSPRSGRIAPVGARPATVERTAQNAQSLWPALIAATVQPLKGLRYVARPPSVGVSAGSACSALIVVVSGGRSNERVSREAAVSTALRVLR